MIGFLMIIFSFVILARLFVLQIIRGEQYQSNYDLLVEKTESIDATRGNIYDRNGVLLAYNELSYEVTIIDSYVNQSRDDRNKNLNKELYLLISGLLKHGDDIDNDFGISLDQNGKYVYNVSGTAQLRFLADVFGYSSINDLKYNKDLGANEGEATAEQVMNYLMGSKKYNISTKYDEEIRYRIAVIRYKIGLNSFQVYLATTVASDISDESVAFIEENSNEMTGISVKEGSIRKYTDGKYYAHIIGYTGTISTDEYNEMSKTDQTVERDDVVGKAGIEQYLNSELIGTKGSDTLYVDSVGNPIEVTDHKDAKTGNDVYLSIDSVLQKRVYNLLENEVAGILVSKLVNQKEVVIPEDTADLMISIYDAYVSLVNNSIVNAKHFSKPDATELEKTILSEHDKKENDVIKALKDQLSQLSGAAFKDLPEEYQDYTTYIISMLKTNKVLLTDQIDTTDETYINWANQTISVNEYLRYAIEQNWIDITKINSNSKYVDTDEVYAALISYILENLPDSDGFEDEIYRYAVLQDYISGEQLCAALYDQGVLPQDDATAEGLKNGSLSAYNFLIQKIGKLEITPGQLGLKPCSASAVVMNPNSGEVLACVTYPGYDNNRLANHVDSAYYNYLVTSSASPMYNNATQQRTAPGSTFKMLSSAAGLCEGVITPETKILDLGVFDKVSNQPKCWAYPRTHGDINMMQALEHSCNYYFYEVGWRLAGGDNNYVDATGIDRLKKYADMFGLTEKTGIEIEENVSTYATEYPVMAAIGQSNNNITTIALARYVSSIANSGTVYNLSILDHVQNADGEVIKQFGPTERNHIDALTGSQWTAIRTGMEMVVQDMMAFTGFPIQVAGKTGTAQESKLSGDHALFVGYAPSDAPQIAVACRIANGFNSSNAAAVGKDIIGCYFGNEESIQKAEAAEALALESGVVGD